MSINDIQSNKILETIMDKKLESGIIPNKDNINKIIHSYFNENTPGLPKFNRLEFEKKTKTDIEKLNNGLNNIGFDLDILYNAAFDLNSKLTSSIEEEELLRDNIHKKNKIARKKAQEILDISSNKNNYSLKKDISFDTFDDFNINQNALINIDNETLTTMPILSSSSKPFIEDIQLNKIHNKESIISKTNYGNISDVINYFQNKNWSLLLSVDNKEEIQDLSIDLLVEFDKEYMMNELEVVSNAKEEENVSLKLSKNGEEWTSINNNYKNNKLKQRVKFLFGPQRARFAKITISKSFSEKEIEEDFLFSIKRVTFLNTLYNNKAELQTKWFKVPENHTINNLILDAKEYIPKGTNVNYSIDIKDEKNNSISKNINNNIIELNNMNKTIKEFINPTFIRQEDLDIYNKTFYSLEEINDILPQNLINEEVLLFKGINEWHKKSYQFFREQDYRVGINDWISKPTTKKNTVEDFTPNLNSESVIREYIDTKDLDNIKYYPLKYQYITDKEDVDLYKNDDLLKSGYSIEHVDNDPKTIARNKLEQRIDLDHENIFVEYYHDKIVAIEEKEDGDEVIDEEEYVDREVNNIEMHLEINSDIYDNSDSLYVEYKANFINYKFTRYFYCNEAQNFKTKNIQLNEEIYNRIGEIDAFYLNNKRLSRKNTGEGHLFEGSVTEGWNRIDYICYIQEGNNPAGLLENDFIEFSLKDVENVDEEHIVAVEKSRGIKEPLTYTNIYDIQNDVLKNETDYFSLYSTDNGYNIIINDRTYTNYAVVFLVPKTNYKYFRLNIDLISNSIYKTPKLKNLNLNFYY